MDDLVSISYNTCNAIVKDYVTKDEIIPIFENKYNSEVKIEEENGLELYEPSNGERLVYHLENIYEGKELRIMKMAMEIGQDQVLESLSNELDSLTK